MKSPFTGKEMKVVKEVRTMTFRKESFEVVFHAYRCDDTGEQFEDDQLAQLNYNQLVNQYRERHAIPFPERITQIREQYGVSSRKMAELLGFGVNNYRQYENGEIPNISNANLITLVEDPEEFKKLLDKNQSIPERGKNKINFRIEKLLHQQKQEDITRGILQYFMGSQKPDSLSGYKAPSPEKLTQMILFFSKEMQPYKTKLNKLLFYSDFLCYKRTGFSISGAKYRAIPMGPVPVRYEGLYEYLSDNQLINITNTVFSDEVVGGQFQPVTGQAFNEGMFSEQELESLVQVANHFRDTTTKQIIELSHQEKAWKENQAGNKVIDYRYSFDLQEF